MFIIENEENTQVDDSGLRNRPERGGKMIGSGWKTRRNAEAVFRPEIVRIFSGSFPGVSCRKEREASRKSPEKIRRLFGRNTAARFH
jgi:hypothetical protein